MRGQRIKEEGKNGMCVKVRLVEYGDLAVDYYGILDARYMTLAWNESMWRGWGRVKKN